MTRYRLMRGNTCIAEVTGRAALLAAVRLIAGSDRLRLRELGYRPVGSNTAIRGICAPQQTPNSATRAAAAP